MANSIEDKILNSIDIVVRKALDTVKYNRTIQAIVLECTDSTIGQYKLQYQDTTFYAYAQSTDITYIKGTSVYVMVSNNDMNDIKTIVGAVKKLGINYIAAIEGKDAYETIGKNCLNSSPTVFEMSSYKRGKYTNLLYYKDLDNNKININETSLNEYIKNSKTMICGMTVKTALPLEQQFKGNYGIVFALDFMDNTLNQEVTRIYTVDVDKMIGNPYKQVVETEQYGIFDIDGGNFLRVNYISLFCYDFPNSKDDDKLINDIFIKDIKLSGVERLAEDDINNYSLTIATPNGTYFDGSTEDLDGRALIAEVRVKGKVINNSIQPLPYYWFTENVGVNANSSYYNKYGGRGWKCLNDFHVIKQTDASDSLVVEWVPASNKWNIKRSDITAKQVRYKCVAVYDGVVISKIITIKNLASNYDIKIVSDSGTKFYFDIGSPRLTCLVNGVENSNYTYSWATTDSTGDFRQIEETSTLNEEHLNLSTSIASLEVDIANERILYNDACQNYQFEDKKAKLNELDRQFRADRWILYNVPVNEITNYATYQCSVHDENFQYLGTAQITLTNSLEVENEFILVINNGNYTYKYNENGISPANSTVDNPLSIQTLSFDIFNPNGEKITDSLNYPSIKWKVPIENTMIRIPDAFKPSEIHLKDNYAVYSAESGKLLKTLTYKIADRYDISKINNTIQLEVVLPGYETPLIAETAFTFIKEGEPGTNGTEFTCKIVPNVPLGVKPPLYPVMVEYSNGKKQFNFTPINANKYFAVELYQNENKIFHGVTSSGVIGNGGVAITWSVLKNKYNASVSDESSFDVTSEGVFTIRGYNTGVPANIIKATVSYNGGVYYATLPIVTVKLYNDDYRINLKEYTGFRYAIYASDGTYPKYDNANPFEIIVNRLVNGLMEDVTELKTDAYKLSYAWSFLGRVYSTYWNNMQYLIDRRDASLSDNKKSVRPADNFDGLCVTNAVKCVVSHDETNVCEIHIPVHLLLNRFGHAALNNWDGNSIVKDDNGGFILAPQVGAGVKNKDNTFTGVLMGSAKEAGTTKADVGLLGYSSGIRSIFLDAETGNAIFGRNNEGQIKLVPGGTSSIAGWQINTNSLSKASGSNKVTLNSSAAETARAFEATNGSKRTYIQYNGYLYSDTGKIGGWELGNTTLTGGRVTLDSSGKINVNNGNLIIDSDGSIDVRGGRFRVNSDGTFSANNGNFEVSSGGTMTARAGTIGGWNISSNLLYSNGITISSSGYISGGSNWRINSDGSAMFKDVVISNGASRSSLNWGSGFSVDTSGILKALGATLQGTITATAGEIGGCKINNGKIDVTRGYISSCNMENLYLNDTKVSWVDVDAMTNISFTKYGYWDDGVCTVATSVRSASSSSSASHSLYAPMEGGKVTGSISVSTSTSVSLNTRRFTDGIMSGFRYRYTKRGYKVCGSQDLGWSGWTSAPV